MLHFISPSSKRGELEFRKEISLTWVTVLPHILPTGAKDPTSDLSHNSLLKLL